MMKAWLSALGKLLAEFIMLLAFLSAAGAFASTLGSPRLGALGLAALDASLVEWPLALALALTTSIVTVARARGPSPLSLLSIALVGLALAAAGSVAREFDWPGELASQAFPVSGQAIEREGRLASVSSIEGAVVRGLVTVDWSRPMPRLSWRASAPFDSATSSALVGPRSWSLAPEWENAPSSVSTGIPFFDNLAPALSRGEGEGLATSLARAFGFVLLCVGLGSFSFGFRLPINALLIAIAAALAAVAIDSSAIAANLPSMFASSSKARAFALEAQWILPGAEALLGIVASAIGLLVARGVRA